MTVKVRSMIIRAALSVAACTIAWQASAQSAAVAAKAMTITAIVETVDQTTRRVLFKMDDGTYETMVASPEVQNLAQLAAGDKIAIRYESAVAAQIGKPNNAPYIDPEIVSGWRSAPGETPGGAVDRAARRQITVAAIDTSNETLTFKDFNNVIQAIQVRTPRMREFPHTLKPGDTVDVAFREAIFVGVTSGNP
jgi:hypothetical protein